MESGLIFGFLLDPLDGQFQGDEQGVAGQNDRMMKWKMKWVGLGKKKKKRRMKEVEVQSSLHQSMLMVPSVEAGVCSGRTRDRASAVRGV